MREGLARRQEVEALALQAHALGARLRDHAVVQLQHLGGVLGAPVLGRLGQATRGALQARVVEACTGRDLGGRVSGPFPSCRGWQAALLKVRLAQIAMVHPWRFKECALHSPRRQSVLCSG